MTKDNFITVPGFAVTVLGLSGNDLLIYSLIYSFSRKGQGFFMSLTQMAGAINVSRRAVVYCLKRLEEAGYIGYTEAETNTPLNWYCTPLDQLQEGSAEIAPVQKLHQCKNCKKVVQNLHPINKDINNTTIKEKEIYKEKEKRFVKPTLEEVREYCNGRRNNIDPQRFLDFYDAKGWKIGKNSIKDWRAAVRTWEARDRERNKNDTRPAMATAARNTIEAAIRAMNKI